MLPNQGLYLEQKQKLLLTPELKQALQLLQMPILELEQYTQQALEENPFLELEEESTKEEDGEKEIWELANKDWDNGGASFDGEQKENDVEPLQKDIFALPSLQEFLKDQLFAVAENIEDLDLGQFIIDSLDNNGYLLLETAKIAQLLQVDIQKAEKIISLIQSFEPKGVGARNLKECLLLQLDYRDFSAPLAKWIIEEYLEELSQGKIKEIAKNTKYSLSEVQEAIDLIKSLNPRPGNGFRQTDSLGYISPDLAVKKIGGDYQIMVNERSLPGLIISPFYQQILKHTQEGEERKFVEEKFRRAITLLKNIEQRRLTILRVAEVIFQEQRAFLEEGIEKLQPLTQKEVAQEVGFHESTVSRVVNSKYCQTPWGIFPLSYFFPSKVGDEKNGDGEDLTAAKIKRAIRNLLEEEDKSKPLSDQKIQELLEKQNIKLARRTVAKYREEIGIPSSSKRKRY